MCSLAAWLIVASALHMTTAGPPVFGTKRYARGWAGVSPYYGGVRVMAPYYATDYDLDYYYQDPPYPAYPYYPSPSPYYRSYPFGFGYEDPNPLGAAEPVASDDEHTDYGMETWYDSHASDADSNARANAMFLQNLILANMYNDQNSYQQYRPLHSYFPNSEDDDDGTWVYGEPVRTANGVNSVSKEDEDVRELKDLVNKKKAARKEELFREQREGGKKWRKRQDGTATLSSTTENPTSFVGKSVGKIGQPEVPLLRPASPVRNSVGFHKPVNSRTSHEPSVYDTIKQLLQMQERLQGDDEPERKSKPQKRSYIPSEESLVAQLGGLKKMAA